MTSAWVSIFSFVLFQFSSKQNKSAGRILYIVYYTHKMLKISVCDCTRILVGMKNNILKSLDWNGGDRELNISIGLILWIGKKIYLQCTQTWIKTVPHKIDVHTIFNFPHDLTDKMTNKTKCMKYWLDRCTILSNW